MSTCVACKAEMDVDEFDVDRGDQLSCPECGANLEVVGLTPVELGLVSEDDGANGDGTLALNLNPKEDPNEGQGEVD